MLKLKKTMKKQHVLLLIVLLMNFATFAQLQPVAYTDNQQKLNGFQGVLKKSIKDKPGVLILPAWLGIDKHAKNTAEQLAVLGYYTFVADIYGEGNYPKDRKEAGERAGYYKKNIDQYQKRIQLALAQLIKSGANPDKIVVIGYCFGGTGALEAARAQMQVQGVVSFHGGLGKDSTRETKELTAKILVCHGADDPYVSAEEVTNFQKEMREAKADWQMIYYANAVHAFTDPEAGSDNAKGAAYNEKAAKRSWQHLLVFLKEVLQ